MKNQLFKKSAFALSVGLGLLATQSCQKEELPISKISEKPGHSGTVVLFLIPSFIPCAKSEKSTGRRDVEVEKVQEPEFAARDRGYTFVSHQQEVGTGYFDEVTTVIQGGKSSVTALTGSTEEEQFH